jgi:hypothetical protein
MDEDQANPYQIVMKHFRVLQSGKQESGRTAPKGHVRFMKIIIGGIWIVHLNNY